MTTLILKSKKDLQTILDFAKEKGIQIKSKTELPKRKATRKDILELSKAVNSSLHEKYVKPLLK
jgi:hypothetical protein